MQLINKKIFIFAGEQSGDIHGSHLLKALQQELQGCHFFGVGGPHLRAAGLKSLLPMEEFQVMGFSGVFKSLPKLYRYFRLIKKELLSRPPDAVILIDYPDFNMRLAKSLRKNGYKGRLIHYICPSVWAWRKGRIKELAATLDLLITIYPFEASCFSHTSLKTPFIGHPLTSALEQYSYEPDFQKKMDLPLHKKCIALFPGSRTHEIVDNLTVQLKVLEQLHNRDPLSFYCGISVARKEFEPMIQEKLNQFPQLKNSLFLIPPHFTYELMQSAFAAIATSGTVTLELALHQVPTVVTYRITPINHFIAKHLFRIRLPFYCIVNILCKKQVFPELFQKKIYESEIYTRLLPIIQDEVLYKNIQEDCLNLKVQLHSSDSQAHAVREIRALL